MSTPKTRVHVTVRLKRAILDPQGRAVEATLHRLGHTGVQDLRVGKIIEFEIRGTPDEVREDVQRISEDVLANPVMEDLEIKLEAVADEDEADA